MDEIGMVSSDSKRFKDTLRSASLTSVTEQGKGRAQEARRRVPRQYRCKRY